MTHQFNLFGYIKPNPKVPVKRVLLEEGKREYDKGNIKEAIEKIREFREGLENYCNRINSK